jgi:hypothetical protein
VQAEPFELRSTAPRRVSDGQPNCSANDAAIADSRALPSL